MGAAILLITIGGILAYSGFKGVSIAAAFQGVTGADLDPAGGDFSGVTTDSSTTNDGDTNSSGPAPSGSPKNVIDTIVVPLARNNHMQTGITPEGVEAANKRHGPTISGGRSDHQGPPTQAWAADMSNGTSPTKEMDSLAADLAKRFKIPWDGSGAQSATHNGYRYQLIYRSMVGGNHYNHVHFGVKKT